jgi:O-antigen/teichoic acid export membrane protein
MLIALTNNLPRYAIEQKLGTAELGSFAAVASFMTVGGTIVNALGQAATPRLAGYFSARDMRRFRRLAWQLAGMACLLGAAGLAAALMLGRPLLGLLYRPAYGAYAGLLTWIMAAALLSYVAGILGYVITSARVFTAQVPVLVAAAGSSAIASWTLVPRLGLNGGAAALGTASLVVIVGQLLILRHVFSGRDT